MEKLVLENVYKIVVPLFGAGWSAPVLFATPKDRFSCDEAHMMKSKHFHTHKKISNMYMAKSGSF